MMHLGSISEPEHAQEAIERIQMLEAENAHLRREVEFLRGNPTIAKGLKGESLVAKLVSAHRSRQGAAHDLELSTSKLLFEVKYSSLLSTVAGRPIRRWVWTKIFGELGRKKYNRLLLVGDADPRFASSYIDPTSPYILFDLPYDAAVEIAGGVRPGRSGNIHLTTNPHTVKSKRAQSLFRDYQISALELKCRYAILEAI